MASYTASGIGAVAGPMLAPWKARKEAKARLIEARAYADSLKLIANAQAEARHSRATPAQAGRGVVEIHRDGIRQRIEFQEGKRQANITSVVRDAADDLGDKEVPDQEPDPDWTTRFFEGVQDVSSEDMRKIRARILSGDVEEPGGTSLRTLSILKDMSRRDAEAFAVMDMERRAPVERHRFSYTWAGELWMSDVMLGPRVRDQRGRKRKSYLELSPQVRGGRCRSSAARTKCLLHNGFHRPTA